MGSVFDKWLPSSALSTHKFSPVAIYFFNSLFILLQCFSSRFAWQRVNGSHAPIYKGWYSYKKHKGSCKHKIGNVFCKCDFFFLIGVMKTEWPKAMIIIVTKRNWPRQSRGDKKGEKLYFKLILQGHILALSCNYLLSILSLENMRHLLRAGCNIPFH